MILITDIEKDMRPASPLRHPIRFNPHTQAALLPPVAAEITTGLGHDWFVVRPPAGNVPGAGFIDKRTVRLGISAVHIQIT